MPDFHRSSYCQFSNRMFRIQLCDRKSRNLRKRAVKRSLCILLHPPSIVVMMQTLPSKFRKCRHFTNHFFYCALISFNTISVSLFHCAACNGTSRCHRVCGLRAAWHQKRESTSKDLSLAKVVKGRSKEDQYIPPVGAKVSPPL